MKRLCLFVCLLVVSASLSAQSLLECAADLHLSRQGDYLNGDSALTDFDVWEYEVGSGTTYNNVEGVTADGLFHVTLTLGNPEYATAAYPTANLIVGRYNDAPTLRPYSTDVDLLVDACNFNPGDYFLTEAVNNSAYCDKAAELYGRVVGDFPNPAANVDRYIDISGRGSLSGWDIAGHIRAAYRSGYHTYALGMMERILARRADWEHVPLSGFDYTTISHGGLLWSIFSMYSAGDIGIATYNEGVTMAQGLLASQDPLTGDWEDDPQTTAFVVLGLRSDVTDLPAWHTAVVKGNDYLHNSSIPGGCGWSYPPEYGEVHSEVMMALSLVDSMPFIDGFETENANAWSGEVGNPLPPPLALARIANVPRPTLIR